MPFKSKKQQRFMFAAEARGEIPKGTARRWAHHTKDIKGLPEKAHKKKGEDMTSSAYELGRQVGMTKQAGPMAWLGRKAIMPAVKGMAKPVEWLLGKLPGETAAGAAKSVGGYRTGLDKAMREPSAKLFTGRDKKKKLEELVGKQRTYGGVGTAAVGIPALATVLAAISSGRRRKAEEAMQAELAASAAAKEADFRGPHHTLADEWDDLKGVLSGQHGNAFQSIKAVKEKARARKASREKNEKEAQLGTPFMDGFLLQCATTGLTEKQTADAIEKAAQAEGRVGEECKAFLERLAACDE